VPMQKGITEYFRQCGTWIEQLRVAVYPAHISYTTHTYTTMADQRESSPRIADDDLNVDEVGVGGYVLQLRSLDSTFRAAPFVLDITRTY
jgi:hypothetical protein